MGKCEDCGDDKLGKCDIHHNWCIGCEGTEECARCAARWRHEQIRELQEQRG